MTGWALFGYVLLGWVVLSVAGFGLLLLAAEGVVRWQHRRRRRLVIRVPEYREPSNVVRIFHEDTPA